jgi:PAS domain S-box-containing protein
MPAEPAPVLRNPWLLLPLYAVVYALAYELGLALYLEPAPVSALWPASGFALGVLLVMPRCWWPHLVAAQAVTHFALTWWHGSPVFAVGATVGDVLEAWLGALLITRWCGGRVRLEDPAHIARLMGGAVAAVIPCAIIGALSLKLINDQVDPMAAFRIWLLGDLIGILVLAPAVVALWFLRREARTCHPVELVLACATLALLTWAVAFRQPGTAGDPLLRPALVWMPMLWIGLRCGPAFTAVTAALSALAVVAGTDLGLGPFIEPTHSPTDISLTTQVFVAVMCTGTLLIASSSAGRRQALAVVRGAADRLRITLASIGDGVIATDAQGRVELLNPVASRMTGWTEDDARGRPLTEVFSMTSSLTGESAVNPVERVLRDGITVGLANHTELIHRDGSRRQIADSGAPIRDAGGTIVGAVLVFRDVTERYQLEERLRQTEKLEAIGRLSSGIAHDLNNMLGGVMGGAELLQGRAGDDERLQKPVRMILGAAERMRELNARLLAFARREPAARRAVAVDRLVEDCAELLRHGLDRRFTLETVLGAGDAQVLVDRGEFQSALLNLAINGRDAMQEGGVLRLITARRRVDGTDEVVIAVQDHGTGMTPAVRARLFEPFFTTKPAGIGTGLGLHAVQGCMHAHGGRIEIDTEPGAGTTVRLVLPQTLATPIANTLPSARALRVLVVDDDMALRSATTAQLEDSGWTVAMAEDGIAGLEVLRGQGPFDAVVLDVVMPRMDGLEMLRVLRETHATLPVLLVSGRLPDADLQAVLALGPTALLAKPYRLADLRRALDELRSVRG